jgi:hypothetical protein
MAVEGFDMRSRRLVGRTDLPVAHISKLLKDKSKV